MKIKILLFILFLTGACLMLITCSSKDPQTGYPIVEEDVTFIIEPELVQCSCSGASECLVLNGESTCEKIRGFKHKAGDWEKVSVNVYERPEGVQNIGKFGYIFIKQLDRINYGEEPTLNRWCIFYEGEWNEITQKDCIITDTKIRDKFCKHTYASATSCPK